MKQTNLIISFIKKVSKKNSDEIKEEWSDFKKQSDANEQMADIPAPAIGIWSLLIVMGYLLIFTICTF